MPPLAVLLPLLAPFAPPRLDADGIPLPAEAISRLGSARFRSPNKAEGMVPSPDGRTLFTFHRYRGQNQILAWDTATGRLRHRIALPPGSRVHLAASRERVRVVDVDYDSRLRVHEYDAATGGPVGEVRTFPDALIERPLLSTNGKLLATCKIDVARRYGIDEEDVEVFLLDVDSGRQASLAKWKNPGPAHTRLSLHFSADGTRLGIATGDKTIRLLDTVSRTVLRDLTADEGRVWEFVISPGGDRVAAWADRRSVGRNWETDVLHVWDVATGARRTVAEGKPDRTPPIFTPDGKSIGTRVWGNTTADWVFRDAATGAVVRRLPGTRETGEAETAAFSPDGRTFYSAGHGPFVIPFDFATGEPLRQAPDPPGRVTDLAVCKDGSVAAVAGRWVVGWEATTGRPFPRSPSAGSIHDRRPGRLSPDGERVTLIGENAATTVCSTRTGEQLATFAGLDYPWLTTDGSRVVGFSRASIVTRGADGRELHSVPATGPAHAVSADGRWGVHYAPRQGGLVIRDLHGREPSVPCRAPLLRVEDLTFAPGGQSLVVLSSVPEAAWKELTVARPFVGLSVHSSHIPAELHRPRIRVSPDGRTLAVTGDSESPRNDTLLVELATGSVRQRFPGPATSAAFSPDGRRLVTASPAGPVYVWDVRGELARPAAPPDATALAAAWAALASPDAAAGFRAVRLLTRYPETAVPFLRAKLPPAAGPTAAALDALVAALDAPAFGDREAAEKALKKYGELAGPAVRATLAGTTSPEVRQRAGRVVAALDAGKIGPEQVRAVRAVEAVEWMGTPASKALLGEWAGGVAGARLTIEAQAALR